MNKGYSLLVKFSVSLGSSRADSVPSSRSWETSAEASEVNGLEVISFRSSVPPVGCTGTCPDQYVSSAAQDV